MQTITVELTHDNAIKALQALEGKYFIKILTSPVADSPALPGKPLTDQEFEDLIASRENGPTVSLKEAKSQWAKQRKQLQKLIK